MLTNSLFLPFCLYRYLAGSTCFNFIVALSLDWPVRILTTSSCYLLGGWSLWSLRKASCDPSSKPGCLSDFCPPPTTPLRHGSRMTIKHYFSFYFKGAFVSWSTCSQEAYCVLEKIIPSFTSFQRGREYTGHATSLCFPNFWTIYNVLWRAVIRLLRNSQRPVASHSWGGEISWDVVTTLHAEMCAGHLPWRCDARLETWFLQIPA